MSAMTAASWRSGTATISWCLKSSVQLTMQVWAEPFVKLRVPHIFSLRRDPFERADFNSNTYWDWVVDHVPQLYRCQAIVAAQIENYVKYPPRQKAASFNLDSVMEQLGPAIKAEKAKEAAAAAAARRSPQVRLPKLNVQLRLPRPDIDCRGNAFKYLSWAPIQVATCMVGPLSLHLEIFRSRSDRIRRCPCDPGSLLFFRIGIASSSRESDP